MDTGVRALYYDNMLQVANLSIPLDSTAIDIALLFRLSTHGFAMG